MRNKFKELFLVVWKYTLGILIIGNLILNIFGLNGAIIVIIFLVLSAMIYHYPHHRSKLTKHRYTNKPTLTQIYKR